MSAKPVKDWVEIMASRGVAVLRSFVIVVIEQTRAHLNESQHSYVIKAILAQLAVGNASNILASVQSPYVEQSRPALASPYCGNFGQLGCEKM